MRFGLPLPEGRSADVLYGGEERTGIAAVAFEWRQCSVSGSAFSTVLEALRH